MKKKFKIKGLDCANCAAKIEDEIKKIDGVKDTNVSFMTENLKLEVADDSKFDEVLDEVCDVIKRVEPDSSLVR